MQLVHILEGADLPTTPFVFGAPVALTVGVAITLMVATIRGRRRSRAVTAIAADAAPARDAGATVPWPILDAPRSPDLSIVGAGGADKAPPADTSAPIEDATDAEIRAAWEAAAELTNIRRAEADVALDPESRSEPPRSVGNTRRHEPRDRDLPRPDRSLPLVAAIATVATGMAFAAGSAVGATVGLGVGALIGLAFGVGAGTAFGATAALTKDRRS